MIHANRFQQNYRVVLFNWYILMFQWNIILYFLDVLVLKDIIFLNLLDNLYTWKSNFITDYRGKLAIFKWYLSKTKLYKEDPHWFKWMADARIRKAKLGWAKTVLGPWCNRASVGEREWGWDWVFVRMWFCGLGWFMGLYRWGRRPRGYIGWGN